MEDRRPRVAIGLPVHDGENFLVEALESILAQTYTDFELIVSDNASTDRTQEICLAYAARDGRIRYVRNETNLGVAPNLNRTFRLARAEYFKWAPHDDVLAPEFLSRCVDALDQHPEAVLCYSKATVIDHTGAYLADYDPGPDTGSVEPHARFGNVLLYPEYGLQLMGLIRSKILRMTRLYGSFPSCDEILLCELALRGPFHEIPQRLYAYRRHAGQSTAKEPMQRRRVLFFDTALRGRIVLPTWRYLCAALGTVRRVSMDRGERARCYLHIGRWILVPAHLRALVKDVLLAVAQAIARVRKRPGATGARLVP
jgi:glycosyltransferase involved in cell wall biosynthesis